MSVKVRELLHGEFEGKSSDSMRLCEDESSIFLEQAKAFRRWLCFIFSQVMSSIKDLTTLGMRVVNNEEGRS